MFLREELSQATYLQNRQLQSNANWGTKSYSKFQMNSTPLPCKNGKNPNFQSFPSTALSIIHFWYAVWILVLRQCLMMKPDWFLTLYKVGVNF